MKLAVENCANGNAHGNTRVSAEKVVPTVKTRRERYTTELKFDKAKARSHLDALSGDGQANFTFFVCDDRKDIPKEPAGIKPGQVYHDGDRLGTDTFRATLDGAWERLQEYNREGRGIFVCIHEMDASGIRATENFVSIRTCVNDLDHGEPPKPYPVKPSFSVKSSEHGRHDYFLVQDCSKEQFKTVQKCFALEFGGDKQVNDLTRVMRLAGTYHRKTDVPFLVTVEVPEALEVYGGSLLAKTFPLVDERPGKKKPGKVTGNVVKFPQLPGARSGFGDGWDRAKVESALECVPVAYADDHFDGAMKIGAAIHYGSGGSDEGLEVFDAFAQRSGRYSRKWVEDRWRSYSDAGSNGTPTTLGTLFEIAKDAGWVWQRPTGGVKFPDIGARGIPDPGSAKNIVAFLEAKGISLYYDELARSAFIEQHDISAKLNDERLRAVRFLMHGHGLRVGAEFLHDALLFRADKDKRHPVREYLDSLRWDGVHRLDSWLSNYAGAEASDYARAVGRAWMIGAVRRAREPGSKVDAMLVLEGPQGAGKSSLFRVLAGDAHFTDDLALGAISKVLIEQTEGSWIVEIAELAGMGKKEVEIIKSMISRQQDKARGAYGRLAETVSRQFVFCGSTNDGSYLRDLTGNRRFWCVKAGTIALKSLRRDRDQLWAEAAHYEAAGEKANIPPEVWSLAAEEQEQRLFEDPIADRVEDLFQDNKADFITAEAVFTKIDLGEVARRTQAHLTSVGRAMRKLGRVRTRRRTTGGVRQYGYAKS